MKILVTGSQGFVGGYLVRELLNRGHSVIGIDNYSKYGKIQRDFDNDPNFHFILEDLSRSNEKLKEALQYCDHLIAGAAKIGGISYFHEFAYDLLANNERIMANTCDAAIYANKNHKLKKVTYLSSSMVYENVNTWPSREGDQFTSPPPSSAYGFQKLAVEYFAKAAWDQYKLPYTIIRIFNCVGVGEGKAINSKGIKSGNIELSMSHVVPDLVQKILRGQDPVHILGDGLQIRHLTYGGDLARGVVLSLENSRALNNDFNISTKESITVIDLVRIIWKKIHGEQSNFRYVSDVPFPYDVQKRIPDTTKALQLLGFEAKTDIETVLDEVIPWIRDAIENKII